MLLYATTTSERASKGQGGEWLDIVITDENKKPLWTIKVRSLELFSKIDIWNDRENKYWSQQINKSQKADR